MANTIAECQEHDLEKTSQYSQELGALTEQLRSLTGFLQTKLQEEEEKVRSGVCCVSLPTVSSYKASSFLAF